MHELWRSLRIHIFWNMYTSMKIKMRENFKSIHQISSAENQKRIFYQHVWNIAKSEQLWHLSYTHTSQRRLFKTNRANSERVQSIDGAFLFWQVQTDWQRFSECTIENADFVLKTHVYIHICIYICVCMYVEYFVFFHRHYNFIVLSVS